MQAYQIRHFEKKPQRPKKSKYKGNNISIVGKVEIQLSFTGMSSFMLFFLPRKKLKEKTYAGLTHATA